MLNGKMSIRAYLALGMASSLGLAAMVPRYQDQTQSQTPVLSAPAPSYSCDEAFWVGEPKFEEGIFEATIAGDCRVDKLGNHTIDGLRARLEQEFQRKEKYTIHSGPTAFQKEGLSGWKYDLTDSLLNEGSDVRVREDVTVVTDGLKVLQYETKSKKIEASGNAGYLRSVGLRANVKLSESGAVVHFENSVKVERPWFAFAFLFKPLSKEITEKKFEVARKRLMDHLLSPSEKEKRPEVSSQPLS